MDSMPQRTQNVKAQQQWRRRQRQKESIWCLLSSLPAPYGLHAPALYRDLSSWADDDTQQGECIVAWQHMAPSCEPCAMLSNPANRGKKHGKTVLEQIDMLTFDQAQASPTDTHVQPPLHIDRRGMHKRWQVESFVMVLRRLLASSPQRCWHVVDFGCGSGALLLPLACLFPNCRFTGVEMKPAALAILRQRAAAAGLTNVHTCVGMIETYEEPFDVALALHACGNATDMAMLRAEQHRAAYIVSPCCIGKLKFSMQGGSSFSTSHTEWQWMPRMAGSKEQVLLAGVQLMAAAQGTMVQPQCPETNLAVEQAELQLSGQQSQDMFEGCSVKTATGSNSADGACSSTCFDRVTGKGSLHEAGSGNYLVSGRVGVPLKPLQHPRSNAILRLLPDPERHFKLMAQVADTNYSLGQGQQPDGKTQQQPVGKTQHDQVLFAAIAELLAADQLQEGLAANHGPLSDVVPAVLSPTHASQPRGDEGASLPVASTTAAAPVPGVGTGNGAPTAASTTAMADGSNDAADGSNDAAVIQDADLGVDDAAADSAARKAAHCALAKLHVELDRNEAARESGYAVGIFRMLNAGYMAKGDLLVGLPAEQQDWKDLLHLLQLPDAQPGA